MANPLKILFISAEVAPFAKAGGLADVAGSLPKALKQMGHDVRVVMPAYAKIEAGHPDVEPMPGSLGVPIRGGVLPAGVFQGKLPGSEVPVYFIGEWNLFNRGEIYGYDDDPYRFAFFSRAALELLPALGWKPDVINAHDWHTAPALAWLATAGQHDGRFQDISSIFTIHNLAHQGRTSWDIFNYLGIMTHSLSEEDYDTVNFMARGLYHSTLINTVSPTYAQEIQTFDGGAGMDGLLRHRSYDLHGILNGIDYDTWDPETDERLAQNFTVETLDDRIANKRALQARAGLPQRDDVPLIGIVSRLDWQKGLDIMGDVVHRLMNNYAGEAQFILLGTGDSTYENMFARFANYHRDKMTAFLSYNAGLAHIIYGGSDMFLMPSLFEPCGLGQMIAMRYGSVPVVRATGGLVDTVHEGKTGFRFDHYSSDAFWETLARAIYVYNTDKPRWRTIQENGMTADFSWTRSAEAYQQLYEWAIARTNSY